MKLLENFEEKNLNGLSPSLSWNTWTRGLPPPVVQSVRTCVRAWQKRARRDRSRAQYAWMHSTHFQCISQGSYACVYLLFRGWQGSHACAAYRGTVERRPSSPQDCRWSLFSLKTYGLYKLDEISRSNVTETLPNTFRSTKRVDQIETR